MDNREKDKFTKALDTAFHFKKTDMHTDTTLAYEEWKKKTIDVLLAAEPEPCEDSLPFGPELFPSFSALLDSVGKDEELTEWDKGFKAGVLKASRVSDKRVEELRAQVEAMQRMIDLVLKDDDKMGGISRFRLIGLLPEQEAISATGPKQENKETV